MFCWEALAPRLAGATCCSCRFCGSVNSTNVPEPLKCQVFPPWRDQQLFPHRAYILLGRLGGQDSWTVQSVRLHGRTKPGREDHGSRRCRSEAAWKNILVPWAEVEQAGGGAPRPGAQRSGAQRSGAQRLRKTQSSCQTPSNPNSPPPPFTQL